MRLFGLTLVLIAGVTLHAQRSSSSSPLLALQTRELGTGSPLVLLGGGVLGSDGWGNAPSIFARTHRVINAQSLAVQYGLEERPLPAGYSLQTEVDAPPATPRSVAAIPPARHASVGPAPLSAGNLSAVERAKDASRARAPVRRASWRLRCPAARRRQGWAALTTHRWPETTRPAFHRALLHGCDVLPRACACGPRVGLLTVTSTDEVSRRS
jgi:hypothetical protein